MTADMIFVVGGTFPQPAQRAAELYRDGFAPLVLAGGKYAAGEKTFPGPAAYAERYSDSYPTEAAFAADVLRRNGVCQKDILMEEASQYTYQNAEKAREVVDAAGMDVSKAILCCQAFHARRSLMYYQLAFPKCTFFVCPADTQGITRDSWTQTEEGVLRVMGELARCGEQFSQKLYGRI